MVPAGSRRIPRVLRYSGAASARCPIPPTGLSPSAAPLSRGFGYLLAVPSSAVLQPRAVPCDTHGLGYCAFARHYLRNHFCFLLLRVLRCFSSPGLPHATHGGRLLPAGLPHSEICGYGGYLPLAAAYRSLSRPSSPPRAKASFMCPCLLSV